jgi:hypothetical protein
LAEAGSQDNRLLKVGQKPDRVVESIDTEVVFTAGSGRDRAPRANASKTVRRAPPAINFHLVNRNFIILFLSE